MSNAVNHKNNFSAGKLTQVLSGLRVLAPQVDKEASWELLLNNIENQERFNQIRARVIKWGGFVLLLVVLTSIIYDWQFAKKNHVVPNGKLAFLVLPDSSVVSINAGSNVKYRQFGWSKTRKVHLTGEALFNINNKSQPFKVILNGYTISSNYGKFNVYYRSNEYIVKCISGEVEVGYGDNQFRTITKGQAAHYSLNGNHLKVYPVDYLKIDSWTRGVFHYYQATALDVFSEIERQFNVKVDFEGVNPLDRLFTGFISNENLTNTLNQVCYPLGLGYEIDKNKPIVRIYKVKE